MLLYLWFINLCHGHMDNWTSHSLSFDCLNLELSFTILMLCVDHLLLAGSRVQMGVVSELIPGSRLGNEEEDADWECWLLTGHIADTVPGTLSATTSSDSARAPGAGSLGGLLCHPLINKAFNIGSSVNGFSKHCTSLQIHLTML